MKNSSPREFVYVPKLTQQLSDVWEHIQISESRGIRGALEKPRASGLFLETFLGGEI